MNKNDANSDYSTDKNFYGTYMFIIEGHLDPSWSVWFDNLKINYVGPNTSLYGIIRDEAAFYSIINKMRDLNLKIIRIEKNDDSI